MSKTDYLHAKIKSAAAEVVVGLTGLLEAESECVILGRQVFPRVPAERLLERIRPLLCAETEAAIRELGE